MALSIMVVALARAPAHAVAPTPARVPELTPWRRLAQQSGGLRRAGGLLRQ
jgi:hypothetical protein